MSNEAPYNPTMWAKYRMEYWWKKALDRFLTNSIDEIPLLEFSNRMKLTAGVAIVDFKTRPIIRLNIDLLFQEGLKFDQTIGHEVSHVFADLYFRQRCKHGVLWVRVMEGMGLPANRCHQYDVSHVVRTRHQRYACVCPHCQVDLKLTQNLITRIRRGSVRICHMCNGRINAQNMGF